MKRLIFISVLMISFFENSFAQPSSFFKMYNQGNSGYAVRELNGNTFAVAGGTDYYYNFHWNLMSSLISTNVHLFKTTTSGNLIWEKIFSSLNHRMIATWMEPVNDGGIIITGHINNEMIWPPDSNDIFLIKTDVNGNISWSKTFDTGKDELAFCVRQTSDNGFIISCFHDAVPTSLVGTTYAMLIKTDSNGNILWEKKYQIPVRDLDTAEGLPVLVSQTADNGYVVTGTTAASHAADVFIFRTDQSGNLLWAKSYEHDASVFRFSLGLDIIEAQSGEIIVAGSMDKDRILNQFNYPYILRVSSNGTLLNAKILSTVPDQLFQSGFSSVEQTPDGGFFFTGMGGYSNFGHQAQFLKTDGVFNTQWSRVYTMDGVTTLGSRSGRHTSDGCYIFTGKRQFAGTVLMKTNSLGLIPCKTPTDLVEIMPSVFVQNRFPTIISGINSSNLLLNTLVSFNDTSTVCPVLSTSLPVELISFSVSVQNEKTVRLEWQTGAEINSDRFIIERSSDGINFEELGSVKAAGNSTNIQHYIYSDFYDSHNLVLYYRLKEIDFNGDQSLSSTAVLYLSKQPTSLINTSVDYLNNTVSVLLTNGFSGNIKYYITDMTGRLISSGNTVAHKNENRVVFDIGNRSKGVYFLNLNFGENTVTTKIFY